MAWNAFTLLALVLAIRWTEGHLPGPRDVGWVPRGSNTSPYEYPVWVARGIAAASLAAAHLVGSSAVEGDSYGQVHRLGWGLAAAELLIRYPVTALVEEATFRGWLQPRLGRLGPVLSALLWAGYHLQQSATIPSLVPFGLVLGYARWRTESVRTGVAVHYAGDAAFFCATYL